jgi:hypothetical protein
MLTVQRARVKDVQRRVMRHGKLSGETKRP